MKIRICFGNHAEDGNLLLPGRAMIMAAFQTQQLSVKKRQIPLP
jgi:hypothetical protein